MGWFQRCGPTKTGKFDPLVYPGTPEPVGHLHRFMGSWRVSYNSSRSDLMEGASTCKFEGDVSRGNHSAYWVQGVKTRDGERPKIVTANAYYSAWQGVNPANVEPPPKGLKMIGRDVPQSNMRWACAGDGEGIGNLQPYPHDCDPTSDKPYITATMHFPSCSDGRKDSANHENHVAYPNSSGQCPATHPKPFTKIRLAVRFDTFMGEGLRLAGSHPEDSDPATNWHMDYMEAWNRTDVRKLTEGCVRAAIKCWNDPARRGV